MTNGENEKLILISIAEDQHVFTHFSIDVFLLNLNEYIYIYIYIY